MIDRSMFRFIWRYSKREQLAIVAVVLASLPFYFVALDLPKVIVNKAIQGNGFEDTLRQRAFEVAVPEMGWLGIERTVLFEGIELERLPFLIAMSLAFLALVIINGLFKLRINTAKGRLGERMLLRLRSMLFGTILRFPMAHFREVKAPELATMIKDEVEPLGGFIGDAYVQPVFLGGQALTALAFIMVQNVWLGTLAGAIALLQTMLIPRLRAPILELGRERQLTARKLAGQIGEAVEGIEEIRVNNTGAWELFQIGRLLDRVFSIRFRLYQKKFLVKFINNFLSQLTPFLFYIVGGYFAIRGQLDVGQLLAVIVAYKELPGPMKELIDWDQRRLDCTIKYEQVVSQFSPPGMTAEVPLREIPVSDLEGPLRLDNVSLGGSDEAPVAEGIGLQFEPGEAAVVGGSGAGALLEALAGLHPPVRGKVWLGDLALNDIPASVLGGEIAYVGETTYLSGDSIHDLLVYPLRRAPAADEPDTASIDLAQAGVDSDGALRLAMHDAMRLVEMDGDLQSWGLSQPVTGAMELGKLLRARQRITRRLGEPKHRPLVERFDVGRYTANATIGENLLHGALIDSAPSRSAAARDACLRACLDTSGLGEALVGIGVQIGETLREMFAGLAENSPLMERFSFVGADELNRVDLALRRPVLHEADRDLLRDLALRYCEARHRLDLLTPDLTAQIVAARKSFHAALTKEALESISLYDPEKPTIGARLLDDIVFGKVSESVANANRRIEALLQSTLEEEGLSQVVLDAGLGFAPGSAARRLSMSQRQRVALARAMLRRPRILLLNRTLACVGPDREARILERVLDARKGRMTLVHTAAEEPLALFDRQISFDQSREVSDNKTHPVASGRE